MRLDVRCAVPCRWRPGRDRPSPERVLVGGELAQAGDLLLDPLGLAVAVGAEKHEVLEAVVVVVPVEVVQTQRQWSASPGRDATFLAPHFEQAETHEPLLEVGSVALARDEL
ncbi:MAG TPA: hypothetical protein VF024_09160, partial [Solirubrobacteraceae bacterium]